VNVAEQKAAVRAQVRAALRALPPAERSTASGAIRERVLSSAAWQSACGVLLFCALPDEPDLDALFDAALAGGKTVALPRYSAELGAYEAALVRDWSQDCATGRHGVVEPGAQCPRVALNQLDFALVPGVAFDPAGRRLGRGKGYYDRLLAGFHGIRCGVAFDVQVVAALPEEPHDVKLNCLATPARWMKFPPANRL
jgi:5-formyltetrahydrofolate cyclo-ligase